MSDQVTDAQLAEIQAHMADAQRCEYELRVQPSMTTVRGLVAGCRLLVRALRDARDDIERIHAAWCDVIQREQRSDNAHYYDMTQLRVERDSLRDENLRLRSVIEQAFREAGAGRGVEILRAALAAPTGRGRRLMPRLIMKEAPDVDFYVEWSSVVEAPTAAGTRNEMLAYLAEHEHPADNTPEMRLARCDRTGTSSRRVEAAGMRDRYAEEGAWDDDDFVYEQRGLVERRDVFTLTRRLFADGDADVSDLLRPFEDNEVVSTGDEETTRG